MDLWSAVMRRAQNALGRGTARALPALERQTDVETSTRPAMPDENVTPPEEDPKPNAPGDPPTDIPTDTPTDKPTNQPPGGQPTTVPVDRPADKPKPTNPPAENNESGGETLVVEICADSGQRATMYCPETIGRRYGPGKAPRRYCKKHSGNH